MNVIFFGTPSFVEPIFEALQKHHAVTRFNGETIQQLNSQTPDLFIVAAYGKILPHEVITIPKYGSLNIHPSLLPKYRGPSPLQATILNGDTETGVSIIQMDEKMDHGPLLYQEKVALSGDETFESLAVTLFGKAAHALPKVIDEYIKKPNLPKTQNNTDATFTQLIKKEDGYFDAENPPSNLSRMIRAYYPWPGAFTKLKVKNEKLKIIKLLPNKMIQVEGKKPMSYKDFINGYPEISPVMLNLFQHLPESGQK